MTEAVSHVANGVERFLQELALVGGTAAALAPQEVPSHIAALLEEREAKMVLLAPDPLLEELKLEEALRQGGCEDFVQGETATLRDIPAGGTGALAGGAESGTLLLGGAPRGPWQWASLLPPLHIAVLRAERIRPTLEEALRALQELSQKGVEEFVWITGPSRTADIAITLLLGMHGPKELHVVVVR